MERPFGKVSSFEWKGKPSTKHTLLRMTQGIKRSLDQRGLTGVKSNNLQLAGGVQLASKERGMAMTEKKSMSKEEAYM
jgi:hypothetical protein